VVLAIRFEGGCDEQKKAAEEDSTVGGLTILLAVLVASLAWREIAATLSRCFLLF